jgi:hypothetical protein
MSGLGTSPHVTPFPLAMFDAHRTEDPEVERYDVSEDGVMWRPFDATRDQGRTLHRRIKFAAVDDEQSASFA